MWKLANPGVFMAYSGRLLPWLWAATGAVLAIGLYQAFFVAPTDYQQGETVRIMFIHVPAAWFSMFCYTVMATSAIGTLVWRHPLADVSVKAAIPIGAVFTAVTLITGSLWGKPMWGTWWVWDARLTSVLVLFLMYLGLMALQNAFDDPGRAARVTAITVLVGFINIPIIKFSVDWWYTLHQPASVFRFDGPTIYPTILIPLLIMAAGFMLLFFALHITAMRAEILRRRIRKITLLKARGSTGPGRRTATFTTEPAE